MLSRNKIAAAIGGVLFVIFAANFQSFPGGLLNLLVLPALGLPATVACMMESQEKGEKIEVGGLLLMLLSSARFGPYSPGSCLPFLTPYT